MSKDVYFFGAGHAEGKGLGKELLGGKGAGLAEMTELGIPVPPGFTITTEVCNAFYAAGEKLPAALPGEIRASMARVEKEVGARFGDAGQPLLVSVRSGARASMPGMMDTILNLGLSETVVEGLAKQTGNPRFAYDCYRRFVAMFGDVVLGLKPATESDPDPFEELLDERKHAKRVERDLDLDAADLKFLVGRFKEVCRERSGRPFPEDPWEQLELAIGAVFKSWNNPRAETYRQMYGYPRSWGTAATVQAMVFGNMGDDCVTGIRTPLQIAELGRSFPDAYKELLRIRDVLEKHDRDMQDVEFTIQRGKLWMLQTRRGKRAGRAMVKVAVDLVGEKLIDENEAVRRIEP